MSAPSWTYGGMRVLVFLYLALAVAHDADVIIVGAGWAGMAAADSLARANVSFLVLEATNRTGGRSHSIQFGSSSVWSGVLEQGSNWISGAGGGAAGFRNTAPKSPLKNPLFALAERIGLRMMRVPGGTDRNMSDYEAVYTSSGNRNGDPGGFIRQRAVEALNCLNKSATGAGLHTSVRDGLKSCGWKPQTEEEWAVDWAMSGEDANGEPASKQALNHFFPDASYQWWGPDDYLVTEQHPRGFARLIDEMVRETMPRGDARLKLNAEVISIQYECEGALVTLRDGREYSASQVIVTLPLGVLQRKHDVLFKPSLPAKFIEVIESGGIAMGNLTHVLLQFEQVWWDDTMRKWLSSNHGSNQTGHTLQSGEFSAWHNLNHRSLLPGSHTLLTFLGDPQSSKYEAMHDAEVQAAVLRRLRAQHPSKTIPPASAFFISRHGYDPNSYGAYSFLMPGWRDEYFDILTQPIAAECPEHEGESRIRFAGEALCNNFAGYTHGAYQSGREVAAAFLFEVGKGPNPRHIDDLFLCEW